MASSAVRLKLRIDPDFEEVVSGIGWMVRDAYDRGVISWARRCELLDAPETVIRINHYDIPTTEDDLMICGIYADPEPAFLAEIGLA
jgi:hypothetical protein